PPPQDIMLIPGSVCSFAFVETHESPAGRAPYRLLATWTVREAECCDVPFENLASFRREPGFVSKLDRDLHRPAQRRDCFVKALDVSHEVRRQLQQDRSKFRTKPSGALLEAFHGIGGFAQALEMSEVATHL